MIGTVSGFLSAVSIYFIMNKKEQSLIKLLLFPLAFRCLFEKILQMGLLPNWGGPGAVLSYVIFNFVFALNFVLELYSLEPAMNRMVTSYTKLRWDEARAFRIAMSGSRRVISQRYYPLGY